MSTLDDFAQAARAAQTEREAWVPLELLKEQTRKAPSAKNLMSVFKREGRSLNIVAEVKRTTSTFADLSGVGDPGMLAKFYEAGGAAAVSVVTEASRYHGSLDDLDAVKTAVDCPVIVNDIIVTPYQVHEARAHGADGLLLVVGALSALALESLIERTHSLGMTALVEVHTRQEALIAVDAGAQVIAIDSRDPNTRELDSNRFEEVMEVVPRQILRAAEGGVRSPYHVMQHVRAGANIVIVGEAALRASDPQQFVAELVAAGAHPALQSSPYE